MELTKNQILEIYPKARRLDTILPFLNKYLEKYGITEPEDIAMFLAQCLHESAGFKYLKEIWGPTEWQLKYEGHKGLGNTQVGDGIKFKGRGLIQLTGRANYTKFAEWYGMPEILDNPGLIELPQFAVLSAIWFWKVNNLSKYSTDVEKATRIINGKAMLGLAERKQLYYKALVTI